LKVDLIASLTIPLPRLGSHFLNEPKLPPAGSGNVTLPARIINVIGHDSGLSYGSKDSIARLPLMRVRCFRSYQIVRLIFELIVTCDRIGVRVSGLFRTFVPCVTGCDETLVKRVVLGTLVRSRSPAICQDYKQRQNSSTHGHCSPSWRPGS
jgi:hypothetical protein